MEKLDRDHKTNKNGTENIGKNQKRFCHKKDFIKIIKQCNIQEKWIELKKLVL